MFSIFLWKARERFLRERPGKPYYRLAGSRLDLLDDVRIVERGGEYRRGYVCGVKRIDPAEWFFPLHFHEDPVMPGSLGIEAILQAMQIIALQQDLGAQFESPRFTHRLRIPTSWRLRGQIVPQDEIMTVEVHIKKSERTPSRVTVEGDGSLWKDGIRIYEIRDAAICLEEAEKE